MRLVEVYTSIQGEGPNTGKQIQFVRFGGCNMRCPGWPCDTEFAIDPKHKDLWIKLDPLGVASRIAAYPKHVCLTGGEPLIQRQDELRRLVDSLLNDNYHIDLFTNGSQPLPIWALKRQVTVVMDWKLPGSGEEATNLTTRGLNIECLQAKDAVKFVITDAADLTYAMDIWRTYQDAECQWWVGKAWNSDYTNAELVQTILAHELPWNLNIQMHKHIWDPEERGV